VIYTSCPKVEQGPKVQSNWVAVAVLARSERLEVVDASIGRSCTVLGRLRIFRKVCVYEEMESIWRLWVVALRKAKPME